MRRRFLTSVLLSLVLAVSILFGGSLSVAVAENGSLDTLTVNNFNKTAWEQNLLNFESKISFVPGSKDYASTVSTNDTYSNSYSVTLKFGTDGAANIQDTNKLQRIVALGAESKAQIPLNNTSAYWNTPNADTLYVAFSGMKIYVFDRGVGDGNGFYDDLNNSGANLIGAFWKCIYDFYAVKGATLHGANVKLEVVSGATEDTLKLYTSKSANALPTNPDASITLHKKGVADGYIQFAQNSSTATAFSFNNVRVNDTLIKKDELSILGDSDLVNIDVSYPTDSITLYDANASDEYVISNFNVYEYGVAQDEEVFSLTFTERRLATENNDHKWGIVLGVDDSNDLSTGKEIKFARNGVEEADTPRVCVYHCTATPAALVSFTYTVKGYAGGRVEISYNDYSTCPTHTAVYNNVDFNGKIAFKIFDDSGLANGYWTVNNIAFSGKASYTAIDLDIIGASVKLTGTQGLRFAAQISEEAKAVVESLGNEVKYGILLTNEQLGSLDIPCINWFNDSMTIYTAVLTDLQEQHSTMQFTAKAYFEVDGNRYYMAEETRSIAQVAYLAVNDYKDQVEDEYIYEYEGKFYKEIYTEVDFDYLNTWASKYVVE